MNASDSVDPFRVAAGMIRNDAGILLPLLVFLAIPTLLELWLSSVGTSWSAGLMVFDRLVQIAVVTYIAVRWRKRLGATRRSLGSPVVIASRIALVSLASSFIIFMPLSMFMMSINSGFEFLFLALFVAGCVWCLRVIFYFAAVSLFGMGVRPGLSAALTVGRSNPMLAIKSLVAPAAYVVLLASVALIPSPDGRSIICSTLASVAEGVFWIGSTYTGLGCALTLFEDRIWREAGLDQYRNERLATLQTQGGARLGKWLSPRVGVFTLIVGAMFTLGNLARQLTLPPSATIVLESATIADRSVRLELRIEDLQYKFRGFNVAAFSIASKTGFAQSDHLVSAAMKPEEEVIISAVPSGSGEQRKLYLKFATSKSSDALRAADNMWLWYKAAPLLPIPREKIVFEQAS